MTPLENNQDSYCFKFRQLQPFAYKLSHKISTILCGKHRREKFIKEQFLVVCLFLVVHHQKDLLRKGILLKGF